MNSRRPRPLPRGITLFTPRPSAARQSLEHRSASPLLWLYQLPPWLLPMLAAGLLVTGMAMRGLIGGIALAGVAVLLGWLAALSWPRLSDQGRLLRIAAIAIVVIAAVIRARAA